MLRYIADGLSRYINEEHYPWHMPGHKRSVPEIKYDTDNMLKEIMHYDVTEVPGVDDLHHPEGMIKKSQDEMTKVYGTFASYYLVNGSTCGIMTAITACAKRHTDDKAINIIIAKNCHKSVFNTAALLGLNNIYMDIPKLGEDIYGSVNPDEVERLCEENENICAVVITSPTYEGIISDIAAIKKITGRYDIPLIVDEAHGSELPFVDELPQSAIAAGADIAIQSLHKTLPSMTQTAVLHLNNKELNDGIKKYLSVYMSSSPSYPMLCSMEYAVAWASENNHDEYICNLKKFREKAKALKHLKLLGRNCDDGNSCGNISDSIYDYDITRLVFIADKGDNINGKMLSDMLEREGNIVSEMSGLCHVVLISSICDSKSDFSHLYDTLKKIDDNYQALINEWTDNYKSEINKENIIGELDRLAGKRAEGDIYVYPPGIPIITTGALINDEHVRLLKRYAEEGRRIFGI